MQHDLLQLGKDGYSRIVHTAHMDDVFAGGKQIAQAFPIQHGSEPLRRLYMIVAANETWRFNFFLDQMVSVAYGVVFFSP